MPRTTLPHPIGAPCADADWHPSQQELEQFALGELDTSAALRSANHLMIGCTRCSQQLSGRCRTSNRRQDEGGRPTASAARPEAIAWVQQVLAQPASRVALILDNTQAPSAVEIGRALIELAQDAPDAGVGPQQGSSTGHQAPPVADLYAFAVESLAGGGLSAGQQPPETAEAVGLRTQASCGLAREFLHLDRIEEAAQSVGNSWRDLESFPTRPSDTDRATLLVVTAEVLTAAQRTGIELGQDVLAAFQDRTAASALTEAQQLFAFDQDLDGHLTCLLRLAEILLLPTSRDPVPDEAAYLSEGLEHHVARLEEQRDQSGLPPTSTEILIQHQLLIAGRMNRNAEAAMKACLWLLEVYDEAGDHSRSLELRLEQARLYRDIADFKEALACYQSAVRGFVLNGQPLLAAIAIVESAELEMEALLRAAPSQAGHSLVVGASGVQCAHLTSALAPILASGVLRFEALTALLLLRESINEGTASLAQVRHCHDLLCAHQLSAHQSGTGQSGAHR